MAETKRTSPLMRFVQGVADVAAVAQARYGDRLARERAWLGAPTSGDARVPAERERAVGPASHPEPTSASSREAVPSNAPSQATPASGGSEEHAKSRQTIGDPDAPPAPPEPHSLPEPCRDHLVPQGVWPSIKELARRFGKDQSPVYAAALSFFSILSIVPLLVVALAALAFLFHSPAQAMAHLQKLIAQILPGDYAGSAAQRIINDANIQRSVEELIRTRGIAGLIGLLSLVWAAMQIFVNAVPAMNAAFEVQETRSWLRLRLVAFGLLLGAGALFLLSLLPSSGPDFISHLHIPWLHLPQPVPWPIDALFWLAALAINSMMFALIYRFLPNAPTSWRQAFVGGLVAGLLWELAKRGFSAYLANFNSYNKVYGALGGLIVLLLWIYYTSMITLLGAEAASLYRDITERAPEAERQAAGRVAPAASRQRARA
jgi:membrane protein